ncbi:MAG: Lrp/AsnC ligand binding domain-containing protein [Sphingomonadales bacterium]|jgi:DNA-binding Lrp family transcriptional regulator|nr:Lrp/AsnC ligand binding domain-containing protein [Sphingomonadales bacterium]RIK92828.1 MAG: AsnC family transcriptional regulator [Pseudomonadota bacterium]
MRPVFVFIKCELGKTYEVADQLVDTIEEVSEVYSVSGQYELLAKFNLEDDQDIGHFVCEKVQKLPHIKDTFTLISFKVFTG